MKRILLIVMVVLLGCTSARTENPADIVRQYFDAWNAKDFATMHSLVSDGFKKVEPTATTLETFKKELEGMHINKIKVTDASTASNDGKLAQVKYDIVLESEAGTQQFSGVYTLRNTEQGWKLIHPYGNNADFGEEQ